MLLYLRKFTLYLIFGCAVFACKKTDAPETPTLPVTETAIANKITIEIDTEVIIADGQSRPSITPIILDQSGKPMQDKNWKLYANGAEVSGQVFTTTIPGNYQLQAKIGAISSNIVEVVARENKNYEMVTLPVIIHI